MVKGVVGDFGRRPGNKFEKSWTRDTKCETLVASFWSSNWPNGFRHLHMARRLAEGTEKLWAWSWGKFGDLSR